LGASLGERKKKMSWRDLAECKGMPVNLFFQQKRVAKLARAACKKCPVAEDCLAWALQHEYHGFFGGSTGKERKAMRHKMGIRFVNLEAQHAGVNNECGTPNGYHRHRRNDEQACLACKRAHALKQRLHKSNAVESRVYIGGL